MKICPNCRQTYPTNFALCPQDGQKLIEADVWSEGTIVREKYRILGKIGSGGMATVYKAQHVDFKEIRALKVISPELAGDESFVRRFKQEAVITRKLQHPNAVRVEDIDKAEDGRPFIVMEYIDGRSLKEAIRDEGPMPVKRACRIVKNAAAALDAAHALGMVHRDIKPANIVLVQTASGEKAKVLDFGIAKIKEGHLQDTKPKHMTLTGTGMVVGTAAYMSPEQAMGKRGEELDGRADIYSLGVVMYQMLAGDLPLKADSEIQMLMAQINTIPPDIRARSREIPEPIAGLVMQCLEKDRNRRPASAQAVIEQIEYWEEGPVRLARAQAEQERAAQERVETKRAEREKAERERLAQEMAEAAARIKAERELRAQGSPETQPWACAAIRAEWWELRAQGSPETQPATLVFYRSKRFYGSKLKPSVYIDGKQVARLANGRYFSIHVSPGPHELDSSMKHRSPVPPDVKPGSTKYFEMEILSGIWRSGGRLVPAEESAAKEAMRGLKPLDAKWVYGSRATTESETEPGGASTQNAAAGPRAAVGKPVGDAPKSWSRTDTWFAVVALLVALVAIWHFWPVASKQTDDGLKYVWIPPGTFMMGCSPGDNQCYKDEKPRHRVTLSKGFWIGQTDVTVGAYKRFTQSTGKTMPPEPHLLDKPLNSGWANESMPIVDVTWDDAQAYCTWAGGRLPTEAEWEYAARGGSTGARYGPLDEVAWYAGNSGRQRLDSTRIWNEDQKNYIKRLMDNGDGIHEVGQKRPNGFGLFDALGNVWQWVNDWYDAKYYQNSPSEDPQGPKSGQYRVLRGGSWFDIPGFGRVSYRYTGDPASWDDDIGFRCAREVDSP